MTTTRYSCPLDCGWHHDQPDDPPRADLAGMFGAALAGQITAARQRDQAVAVEGALREHCESHTLEQWVGALVAARDRAARAERAVAAVDAALHRAELGPALAAAHDAVNEWKGDAVPPAAGSGADGGQQRGYAGESERNPDGTCPDWCPCHRMRADGGQR